MKTRSGPARRLRVLALATALVLGMAGCRPAPGFDEYVDGSGNLVNLVANLSLADWTPDPSLGAAPTTYLGYEAAADPSASLPSSTEVYRLEAKSLLPNGDFAGGTTGGWVVVAAGSATVTSSALGAIHGNTLHYQSGSQTDRLELDAGQESSDGFLQGASYIVRFNYRTESSVLVFEYRHGTTTVSGPWIEPGGTTIAEVIGFPPASIADEYVSFMPSAGPDYLSFGSLLEQTILNIYVDDFRMVRTDVSCGIVLLLPRVLTLPLPSGGGTYDLESGEYRFSFLVHDDPDVTPVTANRYPAASIMVSVTGGNLSGSLESAAGTTTTTLVVQRGADGWPGADASGWAEVTIDAAHFQIDTTTPVADPVIRISIIPMDTTRADKGFDAGSVLIASPSLGFLSALR